MKLYFVNAVQNCVFVMEKKVFASPPRGKLAIGIFPIESMCGHIYRAGNSSQFGSIWEGFVSARLFMSIEDWVQKLYKILLKWVNTLSYWKKWSKFELFY